MLKVEELLICVKMKMAALRTGKIVYKDNSILRYRAV
jgi:hypothetical protein